MKLLLAAIVQHLYQNDAYIRELTKEINNLDESMEIDGVEHLMHLLVFWISTAFLKAPTLKWDPRT